MNCEDTTMRLFRSLMAKVEDHLTILCEETSVRSVDLIVVSAVALRYTLPQTRINLYAYGI